MRPENLIFDIPHVDNQKTKTMTQTQLTAYLKALDEEQDQVGAAVLRLALATGMRKSAILTLRWDDIDLERGLITLRGENAKSGRTAILPLNDMAMGIIQKIPDRGNTSSRARMAATGKASKGWPDGFATRLASRIFALARIAPCFRVNAGLKRSGFVHLAGIVDARQPWNDPALRASYQ